MQARSYLMIIFVTGYKYKRYTMWDMWQRHPWVYWSLRMYWSGASCIPCRILQSYHQHIANNLQVMLSCPTVSWRQKEVSDCPEKHQDSLCGEKIVETANPWGLQEDWLLPSLSWNQWSCQEVWNVQDQPWQVPPFKERRPNCEKGDWNVFWCLADQPRDWKVGEGTRWPGQDP